MDITIEAMVVFMVAGIAGLIAVSVLTGQADGANTILNNERTEASCSLGKTKFEQACDCSGNADPDEWLGPYGTDKAHEIREKYTEERGCNWMEGEDYHCNDACGIPH